MDMLNDLLNTSRILSIQMCFKFQINVFLIFHFYSKRSIQCFVKLYALNLGFSAIICVIYWPAK